MPFSAVVTSTEHYWVTLAKRRRICLQAYEPRYLQIDHRVPYEVVAGDIRFDEHDIDSYMLICGSCNRAKSWSCEHCPNLTEMKSPKICRGCYWASPEAYKHIALLQTRRLHLVWTGDETKTFDALQALAKAAGDSMPEYVKKALRKAAD